MSKFKLDKKPKALKVNKRKNLVTQTVVLGQLDEIIKYEGGKTPP